MKTLEIEFEGKGEVSGINFKQLRRSDKAFMYELTDIETGKKHYEVFERKVSKENEVVIAGQTVRYEEREVYPKSNSFGVWAWCITDFDKAVAVFEDLINKKDEKAPN